MWSQSSLWQSQDSPWQVRFIHENCLMLGYTAWEGFLQLGRGLVACEITSSAPDRVDWSLKNVPTEMRFIPLDQCAPYLHQHMEAAAIPRILNAGATYQPSSEIVLLLTGAGELDVDLLHNLVITPPDCHRQMCDRWSEFVL